MPWNFALSLAQALYLFAPLLVAAAIAAVVQRYGLLSRLARPIDGGASWRGRRVLGDGKTWRGALIAVAGSVAGVLAQRFLIGGSAGALAVIDYQRADPVALGAAMGVGAILGELPNSFVKRRVGIPRGGTTKGPLRVLFYVWDQIDPLIVTWPLLTAWVRPTPSLVVASFVLALTVHPLVSLIGYLVGARATAR